MSEGSKDYYGSEAATFGDRLSAARERSGLTTKQLAKSLGIKHATLLAWEDDIADPRAPRLSMLAGMLNVSVGWLLTGQGEGVEGPEAEQSELPSDITAMMHEMRAIQADIKSQSERLAVLEKRLRTKLKAEM